MLALTKRNPRTEIVDSLTEEILDHLRHAIQRDAEKGGTGHRSTREIADRAGAPITQTRRRLNNLFEAGKIAAFDGGMWKLQ